MQLAQSEGQGIPTIIRVMREEGCPDPQFELGLENVTCILPAHPRHQIIRELQSIQDDIVLGNYQKAQNSVLSVLEKDPHNFRALELFAETVTLLKTPMILYNFLVRKEIDFVTINSGTLLKLSEALIIKKDLSREVKDYSRRLLNIALSGRLEESQIIQAVVGLKRLGRAEEVVKFISEAMSIYPRLAKNFGLLEKEATSRMDLAKKCLRNNTNYKAAYKTKIRAWQMAREYLNKAEQDLRMAADNTNHDREQERIANHFVFLERLQKNASEYKKK